MAHNNDNMNSNSSSLPHPQSGEDAAVLMMVRCDQCGHELPAANLALHRVTACGQRSPPPPIIHHAHPQQHPQQREQQRLASDGWSDGAANTTTSSTTTSSTTPQETTFQCPTCGKHVSTLSATVHDATCHRRRSRQPRQPQQQQQQQDDEAIDDDIEEEDEVELLEQPDSIETILGGDPSQLQQPVGESNRTASSENSPEQQQQQQWSCPQCTLLNPLAQLRCEACGFLHHPTWETADDDPATTRPSTAAPLPPTSVPPPPADDDGMQIEIHEVDPRLVRAVAGATSVVAWSLLGGLVAGPVGMAVGGAASAALAGVGEWQQQRRQEQQNENIHDPQHASNQHARRPRFTFTSTRFTESPDGGSIVHVTTNAAPGGANDGRFRTIVVRTPPGTNIHTHHLGQSPNNLPRMMTLTDRRILELLMQQNALRMSGGPIDPSTMTYDELLERFGVGTEHRRGASPETIQSLPILQLDQDGIESLAVERPANTCCHICLEVFRAGDTLRQLPTCAHAFHQHCIDRWLTTVAACPVCKQEIRSVSPQQHVAS